MANIILSAFADEYSADPISHASFLRESGVGYIEPRFVNGENFSLLAESKVLEYKKILDGNGIKVSAVGSPIGKINLADNFDEHIELAKRCFYNTRLVDAHLVRMFSFYLREGQDREAASGEVIDKLGALVDLADEYGVTLCHENEAKIYGENAEACHELLVAFGGRLKAVFDMGNFVLDGVTPYPHAYELLKDYVKYFHIKDSMSVGAIVPAGYGEANIAEILKAHKSFSNEDFFISLEPHLETFSGLNKLVGKAFENPYKFETPQKAFEHALLCLRKILSEIG